MAPLKLLLLALVAPAASALLRGGYSPEHRYAAGAAADVLQDLAGSGSRRAEALQRRRDDFKKALQVIGQEGNRMQEAEGLSQVSFFFGVLNVPLLCLVMAWWPQHFWVLYSLECLLLIPAWIVQMHRVYRGVLFILDFCWVVNITFTLCMLTLIVAPWPPAYRLWGFLTFFSVSLGPLSWACIVLHNGLVFHSIEKTASLTIHLIPLFVAWTIINANDKVQEAWPGRFPTSEELAEVRLADLFAAGSLLYSAWWVLHSLWLLSVGVDQPAKGRSTVFDGLYSKSGMGPTLTRKIGTASVRCHAFLYLLVHCVLSQITFFWPLLCFWSQALHVAFGAAVFASAAWSGAGYYEYVMARRYTKVVKQLLNTRESERKSRSELA